MKLYDVFYEYGLKCALAISGGVIGALTRDEPGGWKHIVLGGLAAGFGGLLVAHLCHYAQISEDMTFVCVGVSGWIGAERSIALIEAFITRRLQLPIRSLSSGGESAGPTPHDKRSEPCD